MDEKSGLRIDELPSSWEQINARQNHFEVLSLPLSRQKWITLAELARGKSFADLLEEIESSCGNRLLLRGCSLPLSEYLLTQNFERVLIGEEGILNLNFDHFQKKSLRELIKRGERHGKVIEIPFSMQNQQKIEQLKGRSRLARRPKLVHLYRDRFQPEERCFVFQKQDGEWLAAMTFSLSASGKIQTELMLRSRQSPVGVMENLIFNIFEHLRKDGYEYWSLGEVPFQKPPDQSLNLLEMIIYAAGRLFNYAYNAKGLYRFKNKFSPFWREVYLCGRPTISLLTMAEVFYQTKFLSLALKTLVR